MSKIRELPQIYANHMLERAEGYSVYEILSPLIIMLTAPGKAKQPEWNLDKLKFIMGSLPRQKPDLEGLIQMCRDISCCSEKCLNSF